MLWTVLYEKGLPWNCISLIRTGHMNTQLIPKRNGEIGSSMRNNKGVFQGGPLSTTLFIIYFDIVMTDYIDELPEDIRHSTAHPHCKSRES